MANTKRSALDLGCTVDLTALRMYPEPVFRRQAQAQASKSQAEPQAQASSNKPVKAQASSVKQQAVKTQATENNLE